MTMRIIYAVAAAVFLAGTAVAVWAAHTFLDAFTNVLSLLSTALELSP